VALLVNTRVQRLFFSLSKAMNSLHEAPREALHEAPREASDLLGDVLLGRAM